MAHVYGFKRVTSSYDFSYSDQPPPYDVDMQAWIFRFTQNVAFPAKMYMYIFKKIKRQDGCGKEWICEHRWPSIMNLV